MNLYHKLLDLPESDTPPDHYELLGVPRFTDDAKQIHAALINRNTELRRWDNSKYYREADALLDEVVAAGFVLEDPGKKAVYDAELRQRLGLPQSTPVPARPAAVSPVPANPVVTTPPAHVVETPRSADFVEERDDVALPDLPRRRRGKSAANTRPLAVAPPVHRDNERPWTNFKRLFLPLGGALSVVAMLIMGGLTMRAFQRAAAERVVEAAEQVEIALLAARLTEVARMAAAAKHAPPWVNSVGMTCMPLSEFSIGITEVTQGQYERVVGNNPSEFKGVNNPVENVNWDEAVAFCEKLSGLPAERAAGRVYRLPTGAEWWYACSAGTKTKYSFGDAESDLGEYAWFYGNSGQKTHAVATKLANTWGLYDMHGNVWEWCEDRHGADKLRVSMGGGWLNSAEDCHSARSDSGFPSRRSSGQGFRVALSAPAWANSVGISFKPLSEFSIGITEVTQGQYQDVVGNNPSKFKGVNNPVENVSWDEAVAFCAALSELPAERAAGRVYRLPTEAEWEYARRARTYTMHRFGNASSDLGEYAWFDGNSGGTTHSVGTKLANPWGLHDMHGNVWEWCEDKVGSRRRICGGGWGDVAVDFQFGNRDAIVPTLRNDRLGFRLALSFPSFQSQEVEQNK